MNNDLFSPLLRGPPRALRVETPHAQISAYFAQPETPRAQRVRRAYLWDEGGTFPRGGPAEAAEERVANFR